MASGDVIHPRDRKKRRGVCQDANLHGAKRLRLAGANDQVRQDREVFDQWIEHSSCWFHLRLRMGYASIFLLAGIMGVSSYILLNSTTFPEPVVVSAVAALFVDILGLFGAVWKIVLNPTSTPRLGLPWDTSATGPTPARTRRASARTSFCKRST
jgi:hypothetical protein